MKRDGWNPYLAGALAGLLAVTSAAVTTRTLGRTQLLGASTTFVRAAAAAESAVAREHVEANPYFQRNRPRLDWQAMMLGGILIGAFAASWTDRSFRLEAVPPVWRERFGNRIGVRALGAVLGGAVAMFGARLADGCPSGHGLSGLMQLSVSGFLAMAGFFGAGVLAAHILFRRQKEVV